MKKLRLFANPWLVFAAGFILIITNLLCIWMIALLQTGVLQAKSEADKIGCQFIFAFMALAMTAAVISCMPRWLVTLTFDEQGIWFHSAFHQPTMKQYRTYSHVYCATYRHGSLIGAAYYPRYIVLSQRLISNDELHHINAVEMSASVIKIRYSKRRYNQLQNFLPDRHKKQLSRCFISNL